MPVIGVLSNEQGTDLQWEGGFKVTLLLVMRNALGGLLRLLPILKFLRF